MASETVTIALPAALVDDLDRDAAHRGRFTQDAVHLEPQRRRRAELEASLRAPHRESAETEPLGLDDWGDDDESLVDPHGGQEARWRLGVGWEERP